MQYAVLFQNHMGEQEECIFSAKYLAIGIGETWKRNLYPSAVAVQRENENEEWIEIVE